MVHELGVLLGGSELMSRTTKTWGAQDVGSQMMMKKDSARIKFDQLVVNHSASETEKPRNHLRSHPVEPQGEAKRNELIPSKQRTSTHLKEAEKKSVDAQSTSSTNKTDSLDTASLELPVPLENDARLQKDLETKDMTDASLEVFWAVLPKTENHIVLTSSAPDIQENAEPVIFLNNNSREGENLLEDDQGLVLQEIMGAKTQQAEIDEALQRSPQHMKELDRSATKPDLALNRPLEITPESRFQILHHRVHQSNTHELNTLNAQQLIVMQGMRGAEAMSQGQTSNGTSMVDIFTQGLKTDRELFEPISENNPFNFDEESAISEFRLEQDRFVLDLESEGGGGMDSVTIQRHLGKTLTSHAVMQESPSFIETPLTPHLHMGETLLVSQVGAKNFIIDPGMQAMQNLSPVKQVALQLQKAVDHKVDRLTFALDPEHLGKVEVELKITTDKHVQAIFTVENAEAYDLLRRDSGQLQDLLKQAGLDVSAQDFTFNHNNSKDNFTEDNQERASFSRGNVISTQPVLEGKDGDLIKMSQTRDLSKTIDTFI